MKIQLGRVVVITVAMSACALHAAQITTATRSGSGYFQITETTASAWGKSAFSDNNQYVYVGDISHNLYWGILGFKMPPRAFTAASWRFERALVGTITKANVDLWCLGYKADTGSLPNGCGSYADDMDMANTGNYLNGRAPVKIKDDFVLSGNALGTTTTYDDASLLDFYAVMFNRGATTNDYLVLRLNTDTLNYDGDSWRVKGLCSSYPQSECCRAVFTVPDREIVSPVSKYSPEERASDGYFRNDVRWVHQIDDEGEFSFTNPYSFGCVDGKKRSVAFLVQVPQTTTTNLNFTFVFNEPMSGSLPRGVDVELWSLGTVTNRANADMILSASDLAGQTPVKIGDPVLRGGSSVSPGTAVSLDGFTTRELGRYLNSLVRTGERGKWVVFKLEASRASETDWQMGLGSVSTPGEESFLEGLAPINWVNVFPDYGFENGFGIWSTGNFGGYSGEVVERNFAYEGTHVLKLDIDSSSGGTQCGPSYNVYSGYSWFSNRLWKVRTAFRHDSSRNLGTAWLNVILIANTGVQGTLGPRVLDVNARMSEVAADTWKVGEWTGQFPADAAGYMLFPNLRISAKTVNGPIVYLDDVRLFVEELVDFPKEKTGFLIQVR